MEKKRIQASIVFLLIAISTGVATGYYITTEITHQENIHYIHDIYIHNETHIYNPIEIINNTETETETMQWNNYVYQRIMENTKKPLDFHRFCEVTGSGLSFVDSADNTELLWTEDEGETVETLYAPTSISSLGIEVLFHRQVENQMLYIAYTDGSSYIYIDQINTDGSNVLNVLEELFAGGDNKIVDIYDSGNSALYIAETLNSLELYTVKDGLTSNVMNLELTTNFSQVDCSKVIEAGSYFYTLFQSSSDEIKLIRSIASTGIFLETIGASLNLPDSKSMWGITYDGIDTLSFILKDTTDSKNYFYTYSIANDTTTKGAEFNVALMLERDSLEFEKGFGITGTAVYEIGINRTTLKYIADLDLTDTAPTDNIIAITDSYLITDDAQLYKYEDDFENRFISLKPVVEFQAASRATMQADLNWPTNMELKLWDDATTPVLIFEGLCVAKGGSGSGRWYKFEGNDTLTMDSDITVDYSTVATATYTIARAEVSQATNAYYDTTSIPDHSVTLMTTQEAAPLSDCLMEISDVIDGIWYLAPDGKVWVLKITGLVDSGITIATSGITSPKFKEIPKTPNYINLYGGNYLNVVVKNDADILKYGKIEINRYYPGVDDETELTKFGTSLLARNGIATPPLEVWFYRPNTNYLQPGTTMNFQWTHITELATATDLIIKKVLYEEDKGAWIWLTNSTFHEDK